MKNISVINYKLWSPGDNLEIYQGSLEGLFKIFNIIGLINLQEDNTVNNTGQIYLNMDSFFQGPSSAVSDLQNIFSER